MQLKERITFEDLGDKKFRVRLVELANLEAEAAFTHYLTNHKNGVSQFYKQDAIEYIKEYAVYQNPHEACMDMVAEEALQYLIFQQPVISFPVFQMCAFEAFRSGFKIR